MVSECNVVEVHVPLNVNTPMPKPSSKITCLIQGHPKIILQRVLGVGVPVVLLDRRGCNRNGLKIHGLHRNLPCHCHRPNIRGRGKIILRWPEWELLQLRFWLLEGSWEFKLLNPMWSTPRSNNHNSTGDHNNNNNNIYDVSLVGNMDGVGNEDVVDQNGFMNSGDYGYDLNYENPFGTMDGYAHGYGIDYYDNIDTLWNNIRDRCKRYKPL
ncbi:hypothetical protein Sjap_008165 [Stephania japonica]|uniref:Uncharacterized protein n=1 Tax=Stephania japonica TaxID=461633 RepID=A0AAP0JNZ7_9MAGN